MWCSKSAARWCLLGLLFSAAIDGTKATAQDAAAFQDACGDCHTATAPLLRKIRGQTPEERKAYLTDLLTRHHPPDPAAMDQIIGYLLTQPKK